MVTKVNSGILIVCHIVVDRGSAYVLGTSTLSHSVPHLLTYIPLCLPYIRILLTRGKANLLFYAFHIAIVNAGITTTPAIAITNAGIILFTFLY